jgi:hypothetical protein
MTDRSIGCNVERENERTQNASKGETPEGGVDVGGGCCFVTTRAITIWATEKPHSPPLTKN